MIIINTICFIQDVSQLIRKVLTTYSLLHSPLKKYDKSTYAIVGNTLYILR